MFQTKRRKRALGVVVAICLFLAASAAWAANVGLTVEVGTPLMMQNTPGRAYVKVGLTGGQLKSSLPRTPVNVAIVLDRSGSMSGEKLSKAKEAAILAVERLASDDIVSLVTYSDGVEVVFPATKAGDKEGLYRAIRNVHSSGSTALFAGVSKGAFEVRKFKDRNRVNRVILLSDGLANVGPSTPYDLGNLGQSLGKEGISVTTVGLGSGYNEDLMVALAGASDGNHAFAKNATDLARIFTSEFGDLLSVVARDLKIKIRCAPGIRPVRTLGRQADINGQLVVSSLNQIYADQEKFLLLEVEVPSGISGSERELVGVEVTYANPTSRSVDRLNGKAKVAFTGSATDVARYQKDHVIVSSVELIAVENSKNAITLRDQGKVQEAEAALEQNAQYLERQTKNVRSSSSKQKLQKRASSARKAKKKLNKKEWKTQRKSMKADVYQEENQQMWQ